MHQPAIVADVQRAALDAGGGLGQGELAAQSIAPGSAASSGAAIARSASPGPAKMAGTAPGSSAVASAWNSAANRLAGQTFGAQFAVAPEADHRPVRRQEGGGARPVLGGGPDHRQGRRMQAQHGAAAARTSGPAAAGARPGGARPADRRSPNP